MPYPGGNNPAQGGQSAIIAAPLGDQLAEAIAASLRNYGWQVVVTDQFGPYTREARFCVVPLTPMSVNSGVVANVTANPPAPLIPLLVGSTPLPAASWATPPITFTGDPNIAARDIAKALGAGASAPAAMGAYTAPMTPMTPMTPSPAPTFPPTQPYPPYQQPPAAAMPYASGPSGQPAAGGYPPQPGYTPHYQPGAPYMQPPAPQAPRRAPRWPWVVGGVLLLIVLLCGGGLFALAQFGRTAGGSILDAARATLTADAIASATPETTATTTVPANFISYTNTTGGYSIAYPNSWTKTASPGASPGTIDSVTLVDTHAAADMIIASVDGTFSKSDITSAENQFFKSAAGTGTLDKVTAPETVTIAGETWTKREADITTSGKQALHGVVLVANHGAKAYIIGYLASTDTFPTEDATYYQPMLGTFTFLE
jgi:hypothetical protein